MSTLEFSDLRWLHLLWAVGALVVLGVIAIYLRGRALRRFADARLLPRLTARNSWLRPAARLTLQSLSLLAMTAALVHPRWGEVEQRIASRGIDLMVLLDVSRSMLAEDIAPNRLERAKLSIREDLLPVMAGDRIGLIAFAGSPRLKCPLTNDYGFFRIALEDVDVHAVPRGGTLIGDAIRIAEDAFDDKLDNDRLILLITDGEDQDSFPVEAARNIWREKKIPVIVVAIGDDRQGARIPIEDDRGRRSYLTHEGREVWSRADFEELRRIAEVSEMNAFIGAGTRDFDLGEIYRRIAGAFQRRQQAEIERIQRPSRYHLFAAAALLLLLWDTLLREGPARSAGVVAFRSAREDAA